MEKIIYRKTLDVHKNGIQFTLQGFETADNLSRRIEINLTASGDTYELPLEGVAALMYITTPNAEEPSIEECTIKDNTIVYDVLPIVEEGITEMQLKLIGTNYDGAKAVLASPRFAVEVLESEAKDESAEQTTTFTALENAVAKASAVYASRLLRVEFDELCVFRAFYADGTVYESDELRRLLLQQNTDVNLATMVTDGIANIAADDVAKVLDGRYKDLFAEAKYVTDLAATFDVPTFVSWDENTLNTPYKAGKTSGSSGYAIVYGDRLTDHTVNAWVIGSSTCSFTHAVIDGNPVKWDEGWDHYISTLGGVITGVLNIKRKWATITLSDDTDRKAMMEKGPDGWTILHNYKDANNHNSIVLAPETTDIEGAVSLHRAAEGSNESYRMYGEHNLPYPAQIYSGSYKGTETDGGEDSVVIKSPFPIKMVVLSGNGTMVAVHGGTSAYSMGPGAGMTVGWSKLSWGDKTLTITSNIDKWNDSATTYSYVIFG